MTDSKSYLLIINPISGTDSKEALPGLVKESLAPLGCDIDTRYTTGPGDATRLARFAADNGYAAVLAAGGDGTINETAKALCDTGVPLGIIPAGSGNGLARHIGIPVDTRLSLKVIAAQRAVDCDYGSVNGNPFFCTFGLGFDAAVSHRFARQHRRGKLSYIRSAISEYVSYHPETYTISANGQIITQKAFLVAVCNASQYGNNAYIAPEASITDGLLDITVVHAGNPIDTAVVGIDLFTGYINRNTMIRTFRVPAAVIYRSGTGQAHIDGEPVMMDDIMDVKCHHRALRIFAPDNKTRFRPIVTPMKAMLLDWQIALSHVFNH
jgi:YegS/Rv2252/BmrU family lipid kinase